MYESLNDFKKLLIERKLAPENQITFYTNWAGKFIRFSNAVHNKPLNLKIQLFIDDLQNNQTFSSGSSSKLEML